MTKIRLFPKFPTKRANEKKIPKIDTLDALEEHEEHDDGYETITN